MRRVELQQIAGYMIFGSMLLGLSACGYNKAEYQKRWLEMEPTSIHITAREDAKPVMTRNFYFILDGSGSMADAPDVSAQNEQQFSSKLAGAQWAIKKFLETVPADVNIGLYIYDFYGERELLPLGIDNRELFIKSVDSMHAGNGTPLANAISYGTQRLIEKYQEQLGYGEFRLVVVTDGLAHGLPEAALAAAKYGIPIYTIGLCIRENHPLRDFSVSYRAADNFKDLSTGLQETLAELPSYDPLEFETERDKK